MTRMHRTTFATSRGAVRVEEQPGPAPAADPRQRNALLKHALLDVVRDSLIELPLVEAEQCLDDLRAGNTRIQLLFDVVSGAAEITFPRNGEAG